MEIEKIKAKAENDAKVEIAKEIKRMKEILGQEYDYKIKHNEDMARKQEE